MTEILSLESGKKIDGNRKFNKSTSSISIESKTKSKKSER